MKLNLKPLEEQTIAVWALGGALTPRSLARPQPKKQEQSANAKTRSPQPEPAL